MHLQQFSLLSLLLAAQEATGFSPGPSTRQQKQHSSLTTQCDATSTPSSRRDLLFSTLIGGAAAAFLPTQSAYAADEDLTSKMFNPDGSVKEGVETEAKFRTVDFSWDVSDSYLLHQDGKSSAGANGKAVKLSYKYPLQWSDGSGGDEIYFDRSEGTNAKACKRMIVYQAPGTVDAKQLENAAKIGVAKALNVPDELKRLYKADVISGRTSYRGDNGQKYYEFDLAAAPDSCGDSAENLGLGFCPYDDIFLLSATVLNDKLYVMAVEIDNTKIWKLESSKLKGVRSSLMVEAV